MANRWSPPIRITDSDRSAKLSFWAHKDWAFAVYASYFCFYDPTSCIVRKYWCSRTVDASRGWVKPAQADLNGSGPLDHDRPHCPNCVAHAATIAALFRWCDYRSLNARAPPRPLCVPPKIQPLESLRQPGIETPPAGARCTAAAAQICANISGDRKRLSHGRPSRSGLKLPDGSLPTPRRRQPRDCGMPRARHSRSGPIDAALIGTRASTKNSGTG